MEFEHPAEWFDTASEAMRAVDRLRTLRNGNCVIRTEVGVAITEQTLAMVVMQDRFHSARVA